MKRYAIPCGKKMIDLNIPDGVSVEWVQSHGMAPVPDVKSAVEDALHHPIHSAQLRDLVKPGQTVALIVTDITRQLPEETIVPLLLEELKQGGIRKEDITAVVATGTHRPNTPEELREKFGKIVDEISFINHISYNKEELVSLGTTKSGIPLVFNRTVARADIRISTGVIETHLFAGYSGGVKSIAVGVAGGGAHGGTPHHPEAPEAPLGSC